MNFIKHYKIFLIFFGALVAVSLGCLAFFGLDFGIDFTGGTILEVEYQDNRPTNDEIRQALADLNLGTFYVQPSEERGVILRFGEADEETHQQIIQRLKSAGQLEEQRFESIGSTVGQELKQKTKIFILLSLFAVVLYIAFALRKIQRPLKSWYYGLASLIGLAHNILIPLAVFSVLGRFYSLEISVPVVVALLVVLGYSINDIVVVFDRIRENLLIARGADFGEVVDNSLHQTFGRSINTSLTTILILLAIFFFGGGTLKPFSLVLILGIFCGTYASLFLVPSCLVSWWKYKEKRG